MVNLTKVLITGASGNVGIEVLNYLQKLDHHLEIYAGVRNIHTDTSRLTHLPIKYTVFDFTDSGTHYAALEECDILFLLRPPQISDVAKYFKPLIDTCKICGVKHIVFLSVQGVAQSKIIPHHKIEKLIADSEIPYTFLRPAYFMQNFTTTLRHDILFNKLIYLPAGNAKFTLIDVRDIGAVAANIIANIPDYVNKAFDITNSEKLTFKEMAEVLSKTLGTDIQYKSPNLMSFFVTKRTEGLPTLMILVMIMLHYFPRFQKEPIITNSVKDIAHVIPATFEQFVIDYKNMLT